MEKPIKLLEDRVRRAAERIDELERDNASLSERLRVDGERVAILEQENEELTDRISRDAQSGGRTEIMQVLKQAIEELREDD
jgi:hypothetical protein